jgi:hypothetical protein
LVTFSNASRRKDPKKITIQIFTAVKISDLTN